MTTKDKIINYSLRYYINDKRKLSHEFSKKEAKIFLIAAENLVGYIRREYLHEKGDLIWQQKLN